MNCIFCHSYTDCKMRIILNTPCPDGYAQVERFGMSFDLGVICGKFPK